VEDRKGSEEEFKDIVKAWVAEPCIVHTKQAWPGAHTLRSPTAHPRLAYLLWLLKTERYNSGACRS
jgi:hypothetical protein